MEAVCSMCFYCLMEMFVVDCDAFDPNIGSSDPFDCSASWKITLQTSMPNCLHLADLRSSLISLPISCAFIPLMVIPLGDQGTSPTEPSVHTHTKVYVTFWSAAIQRTLIRAMPNWSLGFSSCPNYLHMANRNMGYYESAKRMKKCIESQEKGEVCSQD